MIGSFLVYAGLITMLIGLGSMPRPLKFLGIRTRKRAAQLIGVAVLVLAVGILLPADEIHVAKPESLLDGFSPSWQFSEAHATHVMTTPDKVFKSIKSVTAEEIRFFGILTRIRRFGRPGPESILQAPEKQPLLEVATRTSFLLLAEEPNRELVIGTIVLAPPGTRFTSRPDPGAFKALIQPGFAKATMNFLIQPDGSGGCLLKTETRVFATDATSKRRFAAYWRIIYPGSSLIRSMWLQAIKQRAELSGVPVK